MEELSIEQKVKRYIEQKAKRFDEVLAMAKACITYIPDEVVNKYILNMFPELKENEDEKVRKEIISFLQLPHPQFVGKRNQEKWIAWLEKQGESIKIKKGKIYLCTKTHKYVGLEWVEGVKYYASEDYSLVNQGCTCYCPKYSKEEHNNFFKEVEYDGCLEKQSGEIDEDLIAKKFLINKGYPIDANGTFPTYEELYNIIREGLEHQGEQKSVDNIAPFDKYEGLTDFERTLTDICIGWIGKEPGWEQYIKDNANVLLKIVSKKQEQKFEKQSEKQGKSALEAIKEEKVDNTNKVEPKDYNSIDPHFGKLVDKVEPKFKVGDWVVRGKTIAQILDIQEQYYIGFDIDENDFTSSRFLSNDKIHLWTIKDAKPGDVLFHSDSASNGIFIFKELLKYEFSEKVICYCDYDSEDHFCLGEHHTCCWSDAKILHPATKEQRDLLFQKMKEAGYEWDAEKKELKKIEQKPTWSDEDERIWKDIIRVIKGEISFTSEKANEEYIDWLESLKQRIGGKL